MSNISGKVYKKQILSYEDETGWVGTRVEDNFIVYSCELWIMWMVGYFLKSYKFVTIIFHLIL